MNNIIHVYCVYTPTDRLILNHVKLLVNTTTPFKHIHRIWPRYVNFTSDSCDIGILISVDTFDLYIGFIFLTFEETLLA